MENFNFNTTLQVLKRFGFEKENLRECWYNPTIFQLLNNTKIFVIDDKIIKMLLLTKNKIRKVKLPFPRIFLDATLNINNKIFHGLTIIDVNQLKEESERKKEKVWISPNNKLIGDCIIMSSILFYNNNQRVWGNMLRNLLTVNNDLMEGGGGHRIPWISEDNEVDKIRQFIVNFTDFLNDPEVKIVTVERDEKRNKKRILHGKIPIPTRCFVKITGQLKIYLDKLNSGAIRKIDHKFWVRGHFRTLRSEFWKNKRGIRIWIPPFIKGQGILIKRNYIVKKDGDENNSGTTTTT